MESGKHELHRKPIVNIETYVTRYPYAASFKTEINRSEYLMTKRIPRSSLFITLEHLVINCCGISKTNRYQHFDWYRAAREIFIVGCEISSVNPFTLHFPTVDWLQHAQRRRGRQILLKRRCSPDLSPNY